LAGTATDARPIVVVERPAPADGLLALPEPLDAP